MDDEIDAFIEDNGVKETCCMLLQIICNPFDEYQLNLSMSSKSSRIPKNSKSLTFIFRVISRIWVHSKIKI